MKILYLILKQDKYSEHDIRSERVLHISLREASEKTDVTIEEKHRNKQ